MQTQTPRREGKSRSPKVPPVAVVKTLNRVRERVGTVHRKMVPALLAVFELITGMWTAQAIGVAAQLGFADIIGDGTADFAEIARKAGSAPEPTYRLLRALTTVDLFEELPRRRFRLTAFGQCLRSDAPISVRAMAIFQTQHNWSHWGELLHSVKTGETGVAKVRGESMFDFMSRPENAEAQKQFDLFMTGVSSFEVSAFVSAYRFDSFKVIADVGGGQGSLLAAILASAPGTRGIIYDQPQVVAKARETFTRAGLADRVDIQGGDFFAAAPSGADAYVMKHIIHDWDDEASMKILKHIRKQIPADGRLILLETVVTPPGDRNFSKVLDLEMLVAPGGKERTSEEYAELFASCGFRLERIVPTVTMASVIEAKPV
jgi:hypothetical protein